MHTPVERSLSLVTKAVGRDLSGMPEAFRRAYGPTEAFPDEIDALVREDSPVLCYRGRRTINLRPLGSCRIFAVCPVGEARQSVRCGRLGGLS